MSAENIILFYHEKSPACQKLKQFIPKDKKIEYVNIEHNNNIPPQITSLPAIILDNKEILLGKKVFDYFNKTDDMEYINFSNKNSSLASMYSSIDDDTNLGDSNNSYSLLDEKCISDGLPEWKETESNDLIDIDKLQMQRTNMFPQIEKK